MVTFTFLSLDWSMCSLSQGFPIIGLCFLFTLNYSFCHCIVHLLSVFFLKHILGQNMPLSKILQWLPIVCRIKSPSLSFALSSPWSRPSMPFHVHLLSYHSMHRTSIPVVLKPKCASDLPGGLLKMHVSGPHAQCFWFSKSGVRSWNCAFLTNFQAILMLLVWGPHFKNHCLTTQNTVPFWDISDKYFWNWAGLYGPSPETHVCSPPFACRKTLAKE